MPISKDSNRGNVGPHLRMAMKRLSPAEQGIIRLCLSLGSAIEDKTIQGIAKYQGVSTALVVKAAKRSGFDGFKDMKAALIAHSRLPGMLVHQELNADDDTQTVIRKVFRTAIIALQETMSILDSESITAAAKMLIRARKIDVYAVGGSGALAHDAYHKFLRIGVRANICTDSHLILTSAASLDKESVVLGFSHSGSTLGIVYSFKTAKEKGASTILITNNPDSPASRLADVTLCSVAQGSPITGENAAARVVQLNIFDVLFVLFAQHNYERSLNMLEKTKPGKNLSHPRFAYR